MAIKYLIDFLKQNIKIRKLRHEKYSLTCDSKSIKKLNASYI
jgi:hypothetical protein